jgi:hypothetical protein
LSSVPYPGCRRQQHYGVVARGINYVKQISIIYLKNWGKTV